MVNLIQLKTDLNNLLKNYKYQEIIDCMSILDDIPKDNKIYFIYGIALLRLNKLEGDKYLKEALNNIEDPHHKLSACVYLYRHELYTYALPNILEVIKQVPEHPYAYHYLALLFMKVGDYNRAYYYFKKIAKETSREDLREYALKMLKKINDYYHHNKFIKINLTAYQNQGNKIKPGLIIYSKKPGFDYFPHLIFAVKENKIYTFPLVINSLNTYHIKREDNSGGLDRYLADNIMCLDISDIDTIISEVNDVILYYIITRMAVYFTKYDYNFLKDTKSKFVKIIAKNPDIYDVFAVYNKLDNKTYYYLLLDITPSSYEAIELDVVNSRFVSTKKRVSIPNDTIIVEVIKLSLDIKEDLLNQSFNDNALQL